MFFFLPKLEVYTALKQLCLLCSKRSFLMFLLQCILNIERDLLFCSGLAKSPDGAENEMENKVLVYDESDMFVFPVFSRECRFNCPSMAPTHRETLQLYAV